MLASTLAIPETESYVRAQSQELEKPVSKDELIDYDVLTKRVDERWQKIIHNAKQKDSNQSTN